MGKSTPAPPPPPDPYKVAGAQTNANVNSAIASGVIGNVNQSGPQGTTKYDQTDTYTMTGPDGQTYQVPRYTQTTTLSPEQQQLYDQQTQLGSKMNNLATSQVDRLGSVLGNPMGTAGLPEVTNDFSKDRLAVETALFDRLRPQMDRARDAEETRLVNQGFQRGTDGYDKEMAGVGRNENDMRLAITGQGLQEQQGLFSMQQANRQRSLQEMLALRNQPINEISALMSGGQVSLPSAQQYNAPQIGAAPIGDYLLLGAGRNSTNFWRRVLPRLPRLLRGALLLLAHCRAEWRDCLSVARATRTSLNLTDRTHRWLRPRRRQPRNLHRQLHWSAIIRHTHRRGSHRLPFSRRATCRAATGTTIR